VTRDGQQSQAPGPIGAGMDRLRLPLAFDPAPLQRDLARLDGAAWTDHYVPDHYRGEWSLLPLRAPAGAVHPIQRIAAGPGCTAWQDTELLVASPALRAVLDSFLCPLQSARLMRLGPGSSIEPHRDHDLAAELGVARVHIPIRTNAEVDFRLNGVRIDMMAGSAWYLRLADTHSVVNAGATDRVHLVIDLVVNDWLRRMLDAAAACVRAEPA
jgi:hypothetical protein